MGTDGDFREDEIGKALVAECDGIEMGWANFGITGWAILRAEILISGDARGSCAEISGLLGTG